jgi:acetyl-CoA acetyltransferase family protein
MRNAVIVSAVRTPVGKCGGGLASLSADQLGAIVVKEAVKRAGVDQHEIDEVIFGNLAAYDVANMARMVLLQAGLPVTVPGITVDRQCGSGLNAVAYAAILIQAGYADVVVAGGVESDSRRPFILEKQVVPYPTALPRFVGPKCSPDSIGDPPMGITAENLAVKYNLTRKECDEFALASHRKAALAWDAGYFDSQVVTIEAARSKERGPLIVREDETVRRDTSLEALSRLRPAFKPDGMVTAGNSSPLSDGAGAVVVMEEQKARASGTEVLARFTGFASAGVDPNYMGIGPVASTRKLLKQKGMTMRDLDLVELNEAFAAQSLPCIRELDIDMNRLNVNGGALALGHPLGGTGAILSTKLVHEMKRRGVANGLITFCCGGGQGVSVILENC